MNIGENAEEKIGGKVFCEVRGEVEYFMSAFLIYCMLY